MFEYYQNKLNAVYEAKTCKYEKDIVKYSDKDYFGNQIQRDPDSNQAQRPSIRDSVRKFASDFAGHLGSHIMNHFDNIMSPGGNASSPTGEAMGISMELPGGFAVPKPSSVTGGLQSYADIMAGKKPIEAQGEEAKPNKLHSLLSFLGGKLGLGQKDQGKPINPMASVEELKKDYGDLVGDVDQFEPEPETEQKPIAETWTKTADLDVNGALSARTKQLNGMLGSGNWMQHDFLNDMNLKMLGMSKPRQFNEYVKAIADKLATIRSLSEGLTSSPLSGGGSELVGGKEIFDLANSKLNDLQDISNAVNQHHDKFSQDRAKKQEADAKMDNYVKGKQFINENLKGRKDRKAFSRKIIEDSMRDLVSQNLNPRQINSKLADAIMLGWKNTITRRTALEHVKRTLQDMRNEALARSEEARTSLGRLEKNKKMRVENRPLTLTDIINMEPGRFDDERFNT